MTAFTLSPHVFNLVLSHTQNVKHAVRMTISRVTDQDVNVERLDIEAALNTKGWLFLIPT